MRCEGGMVHGQKDTRRTQQNGLRLMKNYYLKKKCNRRKKLWNYKMRWSEILSERVWTAYLIYTVGNTFVIIIINLIHNLIYQKPESKIIPFFIFLALNVTPFILWWSEDISKSYAFRRFFFDQVHYIHLKLFTLSSRLCPQIPYHRSGFRKIINHSLWPVTVLPP